MEDKTTLEVTSKPKVSIVIPTQHRIHLLPEIIDCFNQQTWWNKELLILDDTPNGKEAIEELQKQVAEKLGYKLIDHRLELYAVSSKEEKK